MEIAELSVECDFEGIWVVVTVNQRIPGQDVVLFDGGETFDAFEGWPFYI
jgi:hypothetical protein